MRDVVNELDEELDTIAKGFLILGNNHPGIFRPRLARTPEQLKVNLELKKFRNIRVEGYSLLAEMRRPLNVSELMKRFKYGWGKCTKCGRLVAARKNGASYRHGWTKDAPLGACLGSGQLLKNWRQKQFWEGRGLL